jgi:FAD/FMN-containing dehydrogenase/Fe-S oxidoreductase
MAKKTASDILNPSAAAFDPRESSAMASALTKRIEGEVRFDAGSRAMYSTDSSNYRQVPIGVVIPKTVEDVLETLETARQFGAPILARGGGTSLAGQCCNVGIVIDMSKYLNRIIEIDPQRRIARVQPGVVLDQLNKELKPHNVMYGPDPSTHEYCTFGGMIGNNSCGIHSVIAGRTADNVESLDVVTYDGERFEATKTSDIELQHLMQIKGRRGQIYSDLKVLRDKYADEIRRGFPDIPRRVSGYNLDELLPEKGFHVARALVGTECTCVVVLEATVRLVYRPPARTLVVLGYPDVYSAGDHVPEILEYGPMGLEGIDHVLVENMRKKGLHMGDIKFLPDGKGFLLVEFGGETREESDEKAQRMMHHLHWGLRRPTMKLYDDPAQEHLVWEIRESGLGATARVPGEPDTWEGWEDSAVHPRALGSYLRELRALFEKHGYHCALYGHFGGGCVHTRIDFDLKSAPGIQNYKSFIHDAAALVVRHGGSLSGEHGDGQSRAELLPLMYSPQIMQAFREFKGIWDPQNRMNPGKIINAAKADEHLRFGAAYNPWQPTTYFKFPDDEGNFARATERCVGVGKCRRHEGGTMCPSYMVTREEMHTTRGRAHLLWEMLQRNPIENGWKDDHVHEALDLCLSCKGCKGDCPINVDMATYKAEFLAHYYEGRLRPRSAYAMGFVYKWARIASLMPGIVNFLTHIPPFSFLAKIVGGIAPQRDVPSFAPETFKSWFERRKQPRLAGGRRVILWPDTFTNHFDPEIAQAAVEVLEAAGFEPDVPSQPMCCGRPLYDFGFLSQAKQLLEEILANLGPDIYAGVPMVVLEPSCAATFRDEMINMLPENPLAQRLSRQTFLLSEFLEKEAPDFRPPLLDATAVVHGHCHHKALMKMEAEEKVLRKLGVDYEMPESGCCGMAGAFGFEDRHYDVSMKCGERVLLPKVREASKNTLIVADGFSCREQIKSATERRGMHLAQVIKMALDETPAGTSLPEKNFVRPDHAYDAKAILTTAAFVVGGSIALWTVFRTFLGPRENNVK